MVTQKYCCQHIGKKMGTKKRKEKKNKSNASVNVSGQEIQGVCVYY